MAIALLSAVNCGPTHFTGKASVKFQRITGFPATSYITTDTLRRSSFKHQPRNSFERVRPCLSVTLLTFSRPGSLWMKLFVPPSAAAALLLLVALLLFVASGMALTGLRDGRRRRLCRLGGATRGGEGVTVWGSRGCRVDELASGFPVEVELITEPGGSQPLLA